MQKVITECNPNEPRLLSLNFGGVMMVTWTSDTQTDLSKYKCTKCLEHPKTAKEILTGCSYCGNKLFTLEHNKDTHSRDEKESSTLSSTDELLEVSKIHVQRNGKVEINVDALFQDKNSETITITDEKGKIYLNL